MPHSEHPFHDVIDNKDIKELKKLLKNDDACINPFNTKKISEEVYLTPLEYSLTKVKTDPTERRYMQCFEILLKEGLGLNAKLTDIPHHLNSYFNNNPFFGFGSFSVIFEKSEQPFIDYEIKKVECRPIIKIERLQQWVENDIETRVKRLRQFITSNMPKDSNFVDAIINSLRNMLRDEKNARYELTIEKAINSVTNPLFLNISTNTDRKGFVTQVEEVIQVVEDTLIDDTKALAATLTSPSIDKENLNPYLQLIIYCLETIDQDKTIDNIQTEINGINPSIPAQDGYHIFKRELQLELNTIIQQLQTYRELNAETIKLHYKNYLIWRFYVENKNEIEEYNNINNAVKGSLLRLVFAFCCLFSSVILVTLFMGAFINESFDFNLKLIAMLLLPIGFLIGALACISKCHIQALQASAQDAIHPIKEQMQESNKKIEGDIGKITKLFSISTEDVTNWIEKKPLSYAASLYQLPSTVIKQSDTINGREGAFKFFPSIKEKNGKVPLKTNYRTFTA